MTHDQIVELAKSLRLPPHGQSKPVPVLWTDWAYDSGRFLHERTVAQQLPDGTVEVIVQTVDDVEWHRWNE